MSISVRIQALREQNHLSQEQLANKLNVSRQAVSKWENGLANPDIENISKLGEIFSTTTDYLIKGQLVAPIVSASKADKKTTINLQ